MKHLKILLKKYFWLGLAGALAYPLLEFAWRGYSHWSMAVAGGLCLMLLALLQQRLRHKSLRLRCLAGAAVITAVEFTAGCLVNLGLGLHVWDYSQMPGHVLGQICPFFCCLWFLLCIPVFGLLARLKAVNS